MAQSAAESSCCLVLQPHLLPSPSGSNTQEPHTRLLAISGTLSLCAYSTLLVIQDSANVTSSKRPSRGLLAKTAPPRPGSHITPFSFTCIWNYLVDLPFRRLLSASPLESSMRAEIWSVFLLTVPPAPCLVFTFKLLIQQTACEALLWARRCSGRWRPGNKHTDKAPAPVGVRIQQPEENSPPPPPASRLRASTQLRSSCPAERERPQECKPHPGLSFARSSAAALCPLDPQEKLELKSEVSLG